MTELEQKVNQLNEIFVRACINKTACGGFIAIYREAVGDEEEYAEFGDEHVCVEILDIDGLIQEMEDLADELDNDDIEDFDYSDVWARSAGYTA